MTRDLKKKLIIGGVVVGLIIVYSISNSIGNAVYDKNVQKIDMALAQNDFDTAKSIARSNDYSKQLKRIKAAEIQFLMDEGELELACQIAGEEYMQDKYYELLMPSLEAWYDKIGLDKLRALIASCPLPKQDEYGDLYLGSLRFRSYETDKLEAFYTTHNDYLVRLMEYMTMQGDDELKKVAIYLSNKCEGGDDAVAKIRAKFGIK